MVTPAQIKKYKFKTEGPGLYNAEDVDAFFTGVASAYEKAYNENSDLINRLNMLAEKLKSYQEEEELIKKTLKLAQKQADELESSTKKACEDALASANQQASDLKIASSKRAREVVASADEYATKTKADADREATDKLRGASATAEATINTARQKAEAQLRSAQAQAKKILEDARAKADEILGSLKGEVEKERVAYETVRAKSRKFREMLTKSYYEQIGMTEEMLGFVEADDDSLLAAATRAAEAVSPAEKAPAAPVVKTEPVVVPEEVKEEVPAEEVFTAPVEEAPVIFTQPVAETPEEPTVNVWESMASPEADFADTFEARLDMAIKAEEAAAPADDFVSDFTDLDDFATEAVVEDVVESESEIPAQVKEPVEAPAKAAAEETPFVNFADFGIQEEETAFEDHFEDPGIASFEDIFNNELSKKQPIDEPAPVREPAKPFGHLNEKYSSVATIAEEENEPKTESFFASRPAQQSTEQTRIFPKAAPIVEEEEDEEEPQDKRNSGGDKPEKKKRRISLFARYEDDDDDEDEDDEDDYDDDEEDDEDEDDGFRGLFRKK